MKVMDSIEVVIKITERCNINCTYCYIFNKESSLYKQMPKQMTIQTVKSVAEFLRNGAVDTGAKVVRIIFHGGEPMMLPIQTFEDFCEIFIAEISSVAAVQFTIQTNGMLVNEEWISVFEKFSMGVGISLDGPKLINDSNRIDHKGRGTYDRVIAGTNLLFNAHHSGRISSPGALCVIDTNHDGAKIFEHLAKDIGFKFIDFLLPIDTYESMVRDDSEQLGKYLNNVFEAWNRLNNKDVTVRFFDQFYTFMTGYDRPTMKSISNSKGTLIITIASDGTYGPDDTLRIVSDEYFKFDSRDVGIAEYLSHPLIVELNDAIATPVKSCEDCAWVAYCVSGSTNGRVVNRFSKAHKYNKRSIYCEGLSEIYTTLSKALLAAGYSRENMFERLDKAAKGVLVNS